MLKVSVLRRVGYALGVSGACLYAVGGNAKSTHAQVIFDTLPDSAIVAHQSLSLLPLKPAQIDSGHAVVQLKSAIVDDGYSVVQLDEIASNINTQIAIARAQPVEPEGITFDQIPLVNELLDEEGNLDMGIELPFSVSVTDVMGSYGVVVSADFTPSFSNQTRYPSADEVAPIDR